MLGSLPKPRPLSELADHSFCYKIQGLVWVCFLVLKNKPRLLLWNVLGIHPQGTLYLPGQTPAQGPSVMVMFLGQCWQLVQMAVTYWVLLPDTLPASPLGPHTLNLTNNLTKTYKGCFDSGFIKGVLTKTYKGCFNGA